VLEVEKLSVFYGDHQALFDVNLVVNSGEMVSLLGANGAGKTTSINTISGMVRPKGGSIGFDGAPIHEWPPNKIVEQGLIQIPEERMLFPDMTVFENLQMGAYLSRARKNRNESLEWVYGLFPVLKSRKSQMAGTLSGGEQQMLAVGRGLMGRPRLLMLDEPSLGLAPMLVLEVVPGDPRDKPARRGYPSGRTERPPKPENLAEGLSDRERVHRYGRRSLRAS
jgi:branched-chain amino acid transport system ATP-binding protein